MKLRLLVCSLMTVTAVCEATAPPEAALCGSCHGPQGQGIAPLGPRLAGLTSEYIASQILLFQTGKRINATMAPMSMTLQGDAITRVSDYFAAQEVSSPSVELRGTQVNHATEASKLAYQGDWQRTLPSCVSCHGPSAIGAGPAPRLAGQQASYLKSQLLAWQSGSRSGDTDNVMKSIASKLSIAEIEALAQYFSTLN